MNPGGRLVLTNAENTQQAKSLQLHIVETKYFLKDIKDKIK